MLGIMKGHNLAIGATFPGTAGARHTSVLPGHKCQAIETLSAIRNQLQPSNYQCHGLRSRLSGQLSAACVMRHPATKRTFSTAVKVLQVIRRSHNSGSSEIQISVMFPYIQVTSTGDIPGFPILFMREPASVLALPTS